MQELDDSAPLVLTTALSNVCTLVGPDQQVRPGSVWPFSLEVALGIPRKQIWGGQCILIGESEIVYPNLKNFFSSTLQLNVYMIFTTF